MSTNNGPDRHTGGSVGHYCIRLLGGALEVDFPGRAIDVPTAPALVGPLLVLALNPRRVVALNTFKTKLYNCDPAEVTTAQIQTPISRLRLAGLPIPARQYVLDVAPSDVDVVDFDHRAKGFIDRCVRPDRVTAADIDPLVDVGYDLHQLWQEDPAAAVGSQPQFYGLFERQRRRNRRFGEVFVRLLLRAGDHHQASDILDEYVDRYGTDEILQDLELTIRKLQRPPDRELEVDPAMLLSGSVGVGALAELWERAAASKHMAFAQLAVSAHNLDRILAVDHVAVDHEIRAQGVPVEAAGGAGANTAVGLARMGHKVAVAGMIADDRYGDILRQSFEEEQVDWARLLVVPGSVEARTGSTTILSDSQGRRIDVVDAGVNQRFAEALRDDKPARQRLTEMARQARLVNLSSFTGDAERHLQEDLLEDLSDETVVTFDPGSFYVNLGLDRLDTLILRCDVLNVYERRLRQLVANSSAVVGPGEYSLKATIEALFTWRAKRVDRPLVVIVKREPRRPTEDSTEGYDMISVAVGRRSVEDLVHSHARAPLQSIVLDITGQGESVAAGIHLGLLGGAPLGECADMAFVFANESNSEIGSRPGLPRRSTIAVAWAKYFPGTDLPAWVPRD